MNPFLIVTAVGVGVSLAAFIGVGYLAYQAYNANDPHKSYHSGPRCHAAIQPKNEYVGTCTICLKRITMSERKTLTCNHIFHKSCIEKKQQSTNNANFNCPNCSICNICNKEIEFYDMKYFHCRYFHISCITEWIQDETNIGLKCPTCSKCTLCLKNFDPSNGEKTTLKCKHIFHQSCFTKWIKKDSFDRKCPDCPFCTICFAKIETSPKTLKCKHVFHGECFKNFLEKNMIPACPNCKKNI